MGVTYPRDKYLLRIRAQRVFRSRDTVLLLFGRGASTAPSRPTLYKRPFPVLVNLCGHLCPLQSCHLAFPLISS